jgi:hypothetical protein
MALETCHASSAPIGPPRLSVRRSTSTASDPARAIGELRAGLEQPGTRAVLLFCSPSYDLARLGAAIRDAFPCPVVGCTSAGQLGPSGHQRGGIAGASLASDDLAVRSHLIAPLSECHERAARVATEVRADLRRLPDGRRAFGLILVDGLALAEERLAATLYQSLGDVPIAGGSAGDDLAFRRTSVYWDGAFLSGAASFTVFETSLPFSAFKLQHFRPTSRKLVTTAASPASRVVHELNGFPAATAYAEALGLEVEALDAGVFSRNPVMLRIGSEYYVRSIQRMEADGSLAFYCAIDEGLVLTVGEATDPLEALEQGLRRAARGVGTPSLVIGCDCVLRRLELEQRGIDGRAGEILAAHNVIGFSTYGEQLNAVHVNQTFTGIALGG